MKTIISLITMLGVAICNAGSHATLTDSVSVEAGIAYSNTSTSGGLAIRDDSISASVLLGSPLSGGLASVGIDLHRADGETEADVNIAWGAPFTLFNVTLIQKFTSKRLILAMVAGRKSESELSMGLIGLKLELLSGMSLDQMQDMALSLLLPVNSPLLLRDLLLVLLSL